MMTAVAERLTIPIPDVGTVPQPYHWTVEAYHRACDAAVFGYEAKVELVFGRVIDRFAASGPTDFHWTADAFDRACDMGVFGPEARLELIHGRVIDRMGQGPLHSILATLIAECLRATLPPRLLVREEKPLRIVFDGEPVTDIMVVSRAILEALPYYAAHQLTPEDVLLIIEIAVTSMQADLEEKALLYARAGVADYWVVLPEREQIVVHREPSQNGYGTVMTSGLADTIAPLVASDVTLAVLDLLGRGEKPEEA